MFNGNEKQVSNPTLLKLTPPVNFTSLTEIDKLVAFELM